MSDKHFEGKSINTAAIKTELDKNDRRRKKLDSTNLSQMDDLEGTPKIGNEDKELKNTKLSQADGVIVREKTLRGFNVPEHILIVFDRVKDEVETNFLDSDDRNLTPRNVMYRILRMFIHNKVAMNDKHCFAIMALNEKDCNMSMPKFSKNPQVLDKALQKLLESCDTEDIFNMNSVFDTILAKHGPIIHYDKSAPDAVYRVIFCYGRSFTLPILELNPEIQALLEAPNFFFDVVFTHEPLTHASSHHADVFKLLQAYDRKDVGYSFAIERNLKAAHLAMARLLGHPLQRQPLINPLVNPCSTPEENVPCSDASENEEV